MRLFIAEKPSLGRLIAHALPGRKKKQNGYIEADEAVVTWCFGHMLEQASPEDYWPEAGRWRLDALPLVPAEWALKPVKDKQAQIGVIRKLLKDSRVTEIVHCGDAGREGQLLIDELLQFLGNKKPVYRFWLHAQDDAGVKRALASIQDNAAYHPLLEEALGRQRADWLIGMNLTRAVTLARAGHKELMTIGRVQTPTLALVVKREQEINHFTPRDYYVISGTFQHQNGRFKARFMPGEGIEVDEEGRLADLRLAENLVKEMNRQTDSKVETFAEKTLKTPPPLPHKLSTLQKIASREFGCSAEDVLKAVQALYEAGAVSYPRTDCQYLPESQYADAPTIVPVAAAALELKVQPDVLDYRRKSRAFNEAKVVEHYALAPTARTPDFANDLQEGVYGLIARYYMAQFYADATDRQRTVTVAHHGHRFQATAKTQSSPGWRAIIEQKKEDNPEIPAMRDGDDLTRIDIELNALRTKPPARFTESSLLDAMENIHRFVRDKTIKSRLKATSGIGTQATRSGIIENLVKRGYLQRGRGKHGQTMYPSELGTRLVAAAPLEIADPGFSGLFEQILTDVGAGKSDLGQFMRKQEMFLAEMLKRFKDKTAA